MSYPQIRFRVVLALGVLGAMAMSTGADADAATTSTGGASVPAGPTVDTVRCDDGRDRACAAGAVLAIRGEGLRAVRKIVFLGGRGRRDDQQVRATKPQAHALKVRVPTAAKTGPIQLRTTRERADAGPLTLDPASIATGFAFPIDGKHEIGTSANQGFGGGRGHQGHDIFAKCGTPIVAALQGTVRKAGSESAAGNYVVIDGADGRSYVYMHMRSRAIVNTGDLVASGQQLGEVGETGRATGCHLHFELWTAPGRDEGGRPVDPLPELRAWEGASK